MESHCNGGGKYRDQRNTSYAVEDILKELVDNVIESFDPERSEEDDMSIEDDEEKKEEPKYL